MEQFNEIINNYISNYENYEKGKVSFDCNYGELIFFNKFIMDLFDEDFINKKVVIHSHKGCINAYIISILS